MLVTEPGRQDPANMSKFCILPKAKLPEWVNELVAHHRVFGPRVSGRGYAFGPVVRFDDMDLNYRQSRLSPKKFLLPQRELLYEYETSGMRLSPSSDPSSTIVFGVHTCDQHAIRLLDRVFLQGIADQHYRVRRDATILIGLECLRPCSSESFCRSMGTTSPATDVVDLHLVDLGTEYSIEIHSSRGAKLMAAFRGAFAASHNDLERRDAVLKAKWKQFPYSLDCDVTDLSPLLAECAESPYWDELGAACLGCGACTQVCPTCSCFDIEDDVTLSLSTGKRLRIWDSCQLNQFAKVAENHDFRPARAARQRHRFMRKGKYQYDQHDMVGCVGCGRCGTACLAGITPIRTFNELSRRQKQLSPERQDLE